MGLDLEPIGRKSGFVVLVHSLHHLLLLFPRPQCLIRVLQKNALAIMIIRV